jgi:DNA-binding LytR/AlgR family response regulator
LFLWKYPVEADLIISLKMSGGGTLLGVVLIDDERCVLEELAFQLEGKAEIAGKFTNPVEAVGKVADLAPDAVFLDVEMPGLSGLEAAAEILAILPEVAVLFITSYDHYAVDAFELNAVDYLVKPVPVDRLNKALERIGRRLVEGGQDEAISKLHQWLNDSLAANRRETVGLWNGHRLEIVPVERIACCFLAKGARQVSVVADGKVYQAKEGLIPFVKRLGLSPLLHCHRCYFIHPGFITGLEPGEGGTLQAEIPGFAEKIPISRNYRQEILEALKLHNKS